MRMFSLAALPVAAALLSGCIYISDNDLPGGDFDAGLGGPERLYGATVEPGGVRVIAASNGCTTEDSFDVDVEPFRVNGSPRFLVRFERETLDRCRAFLPDGVELYFTRERLGLPADAPISIANRVGR
jgi:hypothetical protein